MTTQCLQGESAVSGVDKGLILSTLARLTPGVAERDAHDPETYQDATPPMSVKSFFEGRVVFKV